MKQPPVQGQQIAQRIRNIQRIAKDSTMTRDERLTMMQRAYDDALAKLNAYYAHFIEQTQHLT